MSRLTTLLLLLAVCGCSLRPGVADAGNPSGGSSPFTKVLLVIFENATYQEALSQPFFAQFAHERALLTNMFVETHPSQPNYLALVSGETHGVTTDANVNLNAKHVGDLLEAKGKSWKIYLEDYPGHCFTGVASGTYARKHNPFISFLNVQRDAARCNAHLVGSDAFHADVQGGTLPDFSLYVPNQKNDGHDTGVGYADRWFASTFGALLHNAQFMQGLLVIATFDEARGAGPNHIYTAFRGDMVQPDPQGPTQASHDSLPTMIDEAFGLRHLGHEDARAAQITGIWTGHAFGQ